MASHKIPGFRNATVKEVRELSKLPWVHDVALSDPGFEARVLPDGRVLLFLGDGSRAPLYPSREALEQVQRETAKMMAKGPIDLSRTLLPPIDDFLRDVEAHAKSLGKAIRVPDDALDGTETSLDAVDDALRRTRKPKRMTPEVVTPLVAYVGQVMLGVCGGQWTKAPTTTKQAVPVYDPGHLALWESLVQSTRVAADKAAADVKARRGSAVAQATAFHDVMGQLNMRSPKPIRYDWVDEPNRGHENEPMIKARDGQILPPYAVVVIPMAEPSKAATLRASVGVLVMTYRPGYKPGPPGTLLNPVAAAAPTRTP